MAVFFLLMPSEICLIILIKKCFQTFFILLVTGLFRMPCQIKQAFVKQKGNYFASLNNFIPREKGRCSKVYNFIEICITHGSCVDHMDHMASQKQVGFIYIYLYIFTSGHEHLEWCHEGNSKLQSQTKVVGKVVQLNGSPF